MHVRTVGAAACKSEYALLTAQTFARAAVLHAALKSHAVQQYVPHHRQHLPGTASGTAGCKVPPAALSSRTWRFLVITAQRSTYEARQECIASVTDSVRHCLI